MDLVATLSGLGFGLSLIIAIGAQNAFVLRQGIRGEHVGVVVAICAVSDALLIAAGGGEAAGLRAVVATTLALTWLNPHVYLDTVVLLGSVAATHGDAQWWFGLGAAVGSVLWFTGLGYGARLLRRPFSRPAAWRALDGAVALIMGAIGISLV